MTIEIPPKLRSLEITYCDDLEKLPNDLGCLPSLIKLTVDHCGKLSSFPSQGFPSTLRELQLTFCHSLPLSLFLSIRLPQTIKTLCLKSLGEFTCALPEFWLPTELEVLELWDLEGLTSITDAITGGNGSRSLRRLWLKKCKSRMILPYCLQHLSCLSELWVDNCPALELDCFLNLPTSLSDFSLSDCPKVRCLPRDIGKLTSLKCLTVSGCHAITGFPRGGLPPNLESLSIRDCKNLNQPLEEWGLKELRALRELDIRGCMDEMVWFPSFASGSDVWSRAIPSSLVTLEIWDMKELERLAGGLRDHLTSLRMLKIITCAKMRLLPEEGLPDSL